LPIAEKGGSVEINLYMGINDEKGKSCEYYVKLRILYVHQKVGAVQTIKIYPTTKNSCQVRYI
jgi:hypothetical protein